MNGQEKFNENKNNKNTHQGSKKEDLSNKITPQKMRRKNSCQHSIECFFSLVESCSNCTPDLRSINVKSNSAITNNQTLDNNKILSKL